MDKTETPNAGSLVPVVGLSDPTWREFRYMTMVVGDDAECVALITQVMNSYPTANRAAIAAWFSNAYGQSNDSSSGAAK